jgi:hypothetical protein
MIKSGTLKTETSVTSVLASPFRKGGGGDSKSAIRNRIVPFCFFGTIQFTQSPQFHGPRAEPWQLCVDLIRGNCVHNPSGRASLTPPLPFFPVSLVAAYTEVRPTGRLDLHAARVGNQLFLNGIFFDETNHTSASYAPAEREACNPGLPHPTGVVSTASALTPKSGVIPRQILKNHIIKYMMIFKEPL